MFISSSPTKEQFWIDSSLQARVYDKIWVRGIYHFQVVLRRKWNVKSDAFVFSVSLDEKPATQLQ